MKIIVHRQAHMYTYCERWFQII